MQSAFTVKFFSHVAGRDWRIYGHGAGNSVSQVGDLIEGCAVEVSPPPGRAPIPDTTSGPH